jgi:hypothetical protein
MYKGLKLELKRDCAASRIYFPPCFPPSTRASLLPFSTPFGCVLTSRASSVGVRRGLFRLRNCLGDGDGTGAAALVALGGDDLVVVGAELEAGLGPGVEVGADVDRARRAVALADRPELVKGAGTLDRGLVDPLRLGDGVGAAVLLDGAKLGGLRRWVVVAERLDDVVLDQRVLGPSVDSQVAVALRVELALEVDSAGRAGVPRIKIILAKPCCI